MPLSETDTHRLADNLAQVREQIASAAARAGRAVDEVRLVAVTKYVSAEIAGALAAAGCHDLGESRPQELWSKGKSLAGAPLRWHLIGHLQRNKVRRLLPLVHLIHSADSWRVLEAIETEAASLGKRQMVLLEVNTSGEAAKHGLAPGEVPSLVERLPTLRHVQVEGLMTMAPLSGGPSAARQSFDALRELRDRVRQIKIPGIGLPELSMGMSGDFVEAILAGATIVRIGSALFEELST